MTNSALLARLAALGARIDAIISSALGLSSATPQPPGVAAAGVSTLASKGDHVHAIQTTVSGNAGSATVLQTSRNIAGLAFNGSADISPTTANVPDSLNARYCTDAQKTVIGNTSGTNTGDQTVSIGAFGASPTANGATASGTTVTLQPADSTHPGAMTAAQATIVGNTSGTNSGDVTIGTFGSSPTAKGISISSQAITLQPADASNPGAMTTGAQVIAGNKNFSGNLGVGQTGFAGYNIDFGNGAATNTLIAVYNNGGAPAGFGISSADVRLHLNGAGSQFSFRPTAAGGAVGTISGAGVCDMASYTASSVAVLTQTNSISSITNKSFTTPGIAGATLSGTLAGACTFSGTLSLTNFVTLNVPLVRSGLSSITAHAGGGQASAVALTKEVNYIGTVATIADSVKLPTPALGQRIVIFNLAANSCNVYPVSGSAIDALGTDAPYALAGGTSKEFWGQTTTLSRSR